MKNFCGETRRRFFKHWSPHREIKGEITLLIGKPVAWR